MEESALVIPVALPEILERIRRQYDPVAQDLPPHLSLLVPFAERPADQTVDSRLRRVARRFMPLALKAQSVGAFLGEGLDTIYLVLCVHPELQNMMDMVFAEFPEHPPYAGKHDEIIPHVTLAQVNRAKAPNVQALAEKALEELGGTVWLDGTSLAWITHDQQGWRTATYPLGPLVETAP